MTHDETYKAAMGLLTLPPVLVRAAVEAMSTAQRRDVSHFLERLAERAAWLATYLEERTGYGCGDQGHEQAVRNANRAGRAVWCKAFGYNAHAELRV